ncbi:MAG: methionine biosynthesis protein MetW [Planctomycetota bacterium]|jgi:methionine biosynthesis protein MetW|nr:methionine biosynthesis protein MetW [Planctomycetota bacterium]
MNDDNHSQELDELASLLRDHVDPDLQMHGGGLFATFVNELHHVDDKDGPLGRTSRWQDDVIVEAIASGSRVLDLGCGTGELLEHLKGKAGRLQGVEVDHDQVAACVARGVPVFQADVDAGLREFDDDSFDYVVLEETLQALRHPHDVLHEMLRIGRCGIVSFPNFGHWRIRLYLAAHGRMPVSHRLPHQWFDTPNIHHLTLRDFKAWCNDNAVIIDRAMVLADGVVRPFAEGDNLHASEVLLFIRRS